MAHPASSTSPTGGDSVMEAAPKLRTGYLSLLLPTSAPHGDVPALVRQLVVDALAATGEWPARVTIVTNQRAQQGPMTRWFVEYETGDPSR